MVKNRYNLKKITVVEPEGSFIHSMVIDGNSVAVKFKTSESVSNYVLSDAQKQQLLAVAKQGLSCGGFYNAHLRGHSISRTVPRAEFEAGA